MPHRHPVPKCWLMTDSRMGDRLWEALERLPRGSGVVVRHYDLPLGERRALFARIAAIGRRRDLVVLRAGSDRLARREAGVHGRSQRHSRGLKSWPAHSAQEVVAGIRAGAQVIFVSPVFATRSHPGGRPLGRVRALAMLAGTPVPVIAMGGMTKRRARWAQAGGFYGWAAIDAWL